MTRRTRPVTVIGWLFIVVGAAGLLNDWLPLLTSRAAEHAAGLRSEGTGMLAVIWTVRLLAVIGGAGLLRGFVWSRWLLGVWMAFHIALSATHSSGALLLHAAVFGVIGYFLFRRAAAAAAAVIVAAAVCGGAPGHPVHVQAQERVTFRTQDGALIHADLYGRGDRGVVLAHGGRFDKESWADQARALERAGLRVLAFDFRGYGESSGPGQSDPLGASLHLDVLAAVRYLRGAGAATVSIVGGSMGAAAAADAALEAAPGEIDGVVLLGAGAGRSPERLAVRTLFIVTRDDASGAGPRLPRIQADYDRTPEPKRLVVLDGSAHAQQMFQTADADRVMREILRFLAAPPEGNAIR